MQRGKNETSLAIKNFKEKTEARNKETIFGPLRVVNVKKYACKSWTFQSISQSDSKGL